MPPTRGTSLLTPTAVEIRITPANTFFSVMHIDGVDNISPNRFNDSNASSISWTDKQRWCFFFLGTKAPTNASTRPNLSLTTGHVTTVSTFRDNWSCGASVNTTREESTQLIKPDGRLGSERQALPKTKASVAS